MPRIRVSCGRATGPGRTGTAPPRRQYSISLSGQAEIEVGDGTIARVGPGDVVLAEDLTGQGHITRVVGTEPRVYAIVPLIG